MKLIVHLPHETRHIEHAHTVEVIADELHLVTGEYIDSHEEEQTIDYTDKIEIKEA